MKRNILKIGLFVIVCSGLFFGCDKMPLSYLKITKIHYPLDNLVVVKGLTLNDTLNPKVGPFMQTPSKYAYRIKNSAPWVAAGFYGASVEGSRPLTVTLVNVKAEGPEANAEILKSEIKVIGEGRVEIPYDTKIPLGKYKLSFKISNIHGSKIVEDVFQVTVTDKKW